MSYHLACLVCISVARSRSLETRSVVVWRVGKSSGTSINASISLVEPRRIGYFADPNFEVHGYMTCAAPEQIGKYGDAFMHDDDSGFAFRLIQQRFTIWTFLCSWEDVW